MTARKISWRLSAIFAVTQMAEGSALVLPSGRMGVLGFTGRQISYVFASGALAALISPLIAGWLADRYWSSQRFLIPAAVTMFALVLFAVLFHDGPRQRPPARMP